MFEEFCGFDSAFVAFVFGVGEEEFYAVAGVDLGAFLDELFGGDDLAHVLLVLFGFSGHALGDYEVPDWDVAVEEFLPVLSDDLQGRGNSLAEFGRVVRLERALIKGANRTAKLEVFTQDLSAKLLEMSKG